MTFHNRLTVFLLLLIAPCALAKPVTITSPDRNIVFSLDQGPKGLVYRVSYKGNLLVSDSKLSISFKEGGEFGNNVSMGKPAFQKMEETYDLIVGRSSHVHSLSNEAMVPITETGGLKRELNIEIRVFNDGAAFRYVIPGKPGW